MKIAPGQAVEFQVGMGEIQLLCRAQKSKWGSESLPHWLSQCKASSNLLHFEQVATALS